MAIKALNSIGGFSVGENPSNVILANGDITSNNANFTGNLLGNVANFTGNLTGTNANFSGSLITGNIKTNTYLYANGDPVNFTNPSGSNTQIQFNNGDSNFGGSANFTFSKDTNTLVLTNGVANISNINISTHANLGNVGNVVITGGTSGYLLHTDGQGNLTWEAPVGGGGIGGTDTQIQFNDGGSFAGNANLTFNKSTNQLTVGGGTGGAISGANSVTANFFIGVFDSTSSSQPNITSVGTLTDLTVTGNVSPGGIKTDDYYYANGDPVNFTNPTGNNTEVQFNNGDGNFGADANFTYNHDTELLTVGNANVVANFAAGNIYSSGLANVANLDVVYNANVTANLTANNANVTNEFTSNNANVRANLTANNANVTNEFTSNTANITANLTANNANVTNDFTSNNANITANLTANNANVTNDLTSNNANITANLTANNANVTNEFTSNTANIRANLIANNANVTNDFTSNNANITANLIAGNAVITTTANVGNLIIASGGVFTGDLIPSSNLGSNLGNTTNRFKDLWLSGSTINIGNTTISASDDEIVMGNANITANLIAGNLHVSGNGQFDTDVTITGNLIVGGSTAYVNVTNISVKDPIIDVGGLANGANLDAYDGKDRGILLHNYDSGDDTPINQFFGWKTGNTEFVAASNISVTGEVITINSLANIRVNAIQGNLQGTVLASSQTNITSVGTLIGLNIAGTGNGNLSVANTANVGTLIASSITYPTSDGAGNTVLTTWGNGKTRFTSIETDHISNGTSNISISTANGNITLNANGNATATITSTGANITGYANVTGNLIANNAQIANNVSIGNTNINWGNVTTVSTGANQVIARVASSGIRGVEFFVKGEDVDGGKYSVGTLQAVHDGSDVDYASYGTVVMGGTPGYLRVLWNSGNIDLVVTPASSNSTLWITQYKTL